MLETLPGVYHQKNNTFLNISSEIFRDFSTQDERLWKNQRVSDRTFYNSTYRLFSLRIGKAL